MSGNQDKLKIKGEIINILGINNVTSIRDILEDNKLSQQNNMRSRILSIVSNPSNSNYIDDIELIQALENTQLTFEQIFTPLQVQPDYTFNNVTLSQYESPKQNTIQIKSTVTFSLPNVPQENDFKQVRNIVENIINVNYNTITNDDKTLLVEIYKSAYENEIVRESINVNNGVQLITNSDIQGNVNVIVSSGASDNIMLTINVTNIGSQEKLSLIQSSMMNINTNTDLYNEILNQIPIKQASTGLTLSFNNTNIPQSGDITVQLSRLYPSGAVRILSSLSAMEEKSVLDLSPVESAVMKESYIKVYIDKMASNGIVIARNNIKAELTDGSIKVGITILDAESVTTTGGGTLSNIASVEDAFTAIETTPTEIVSASTEIINNIENFNIPITEITDENGNTIDIATQLSTTTNFFGNPEFVQALESAETETVTLLVSSTGELQGFTISRGPGPSGLGIKILPNKDAGMVINDKKRNTIKKGKLNKNILQESNSIIYNVNRSALRRVRSSGSRAPIRRAIKC